MSAYEGKINKLNIIDDLLQEVKLLPPISNWGILAFESGVFIFSETGSYYQTLVNDEGELQMSYLSKIPLETIIPNPVYRSIPIMKGVVVARKVAFGFDTELTQLETVCNELRTISHWGEKNILALQSPNLSNLLFNVSELICQVDQPTFLSIMNNSAVESIQQV